MTQAMKVYQIAEALGMDHEIVVAKIRCTSNLRKRPLYFLAVLCGILFGPSTVLTAGAVVVVETPMDRAIEPVAHKLDKIITKSIASPTFSSSLSVLLTNLSLSESISAQSSIFDGTQR